MSLIEVVAALVLLATTVTALLAAQGASLEQLRATRDQETATALATELMTSWKLERIDPRSSTEGRLAGDTEWRWTRTARPYASPSSRLWEIELTVYRMGEATAEQQIGQWTWLERIDEAGDKP